MTTPQDKTLQAVTRQLAAMGCPTFEVGIRDRATGRTMIRPWTIEEVKKALPWLRRENARDADIYIRPQGSVGLVLVDDLLLGTLDRMKAEGFAPALITRTSSDNYQAWIRLSKDPLPPMVATAAARLLAARFGGDPNSADWRHFGRLAGYTNRKPERVDDMGRHPFVLLWEALGRSAPGGPDLLKEAWLALRAAEDAEASRSRARAQAPRSAPVAGADPLAFHARILADLRARFSPLDPSRSDWMACERMGKAGFTPEQIYQAILIGSPNLEERKRGHIEDYVTRTVAYALGMVAPGAPGAPDLLKEAGLAMRAALDAEAPTWSSASAATSRSMQPPPFPEPWE